MQAKVRLNLAVSKALVNYGDYLDLLKRTANSLSSAKGNSAIKTTLIGVNSPDQYGVIEITLDISCLSQTVGEEIVISEFAKNLKSSLNRITVVIEGNVVKKTTWF